MNSSNGVLAMLVATLLNAASGAGIYYSHQLDSQFSTTVGIFLRVMANFSVLAIPLVARRPLPRLESTKAGRDLWFWGLFGCLTLSTYYYSVTIIGAGRATMLNAGGGVFIAALAPSITGQSFNRGHFLASVGSLIGIVLVLVSTTKDSLAIEGALFATASGLFNALAYLMVARTRKNHSTESILLHWAVINLVLIISTIFFRPWVWPSSTKVWIALIVTSLLMALAQYFTALAFQVGRATLLACLGFLGPLINLSMDLFIFRVPVSAMAMCGLCIVVLFGVAWPLARRQEL